MQFKFCLLIILFNLCFLEGTRNWWMFNHNFMFLLQLYSWPENTLLEIFYWKGIMNLLKIMKSNAFINLCSQFLNATFYLEPLKWVITREPIRLITGSGRVGLKKNYKFQYKLKMNPTH